MQRAHLLISGKVQGVWYRHSTVVQAKRLNLTGWVCNLPDGRVEVVAEGTTEALQQLVAYCHEGPPLAHVQEVQVHWDTATGEFSDFAQK